MEALAPTIVTFWVIASILWAVTLIFVAIDKNAKEDNHQRWKWFALAVFVGPIMLIPYFLWGRESVKKK